MASIASGSRPCSRVVSTTAPGIAAASAAISPGLCTPPPQAITRCVRGCAASRASATVRAVRASRVAWTSAGDSLPDRRASTQARWKRSRPVDFGGAWVNQASSSSRDSSAASTVPLRANAPSRS